MADRNLYGDQRSYLRRLVEVIGAVPIGATGAVGAALGKGYSIVRTGVGLYTVTFKDNFVNLLEASADVGLVNSTPGAGNPCWVTPGPFTQFSGTTKATLALYVWNPGGTALQDPPSGAVLYFSALFQNSADVANGGVA